MTYRKKLIEVALPLDAINKESAREKSIRHGHPSTLHLWWARRPLAACRAVIFSSLVDDPDEPNAPKKYLEALDRLERRPPGDSDDRRDKLFYFIERLVKWESTTDEKILGQARELINLSCEGKPPPLLDPFCGGGSIPLEGQRLGLEVYASDLNPVAVLITKALIEIPPKFAGRPPVNPDDRAKMGADAVWKGSAGLAADLRYYGKWMRDRAGERSGHLYPKGPNGETVIAWLWARTVKCPNPACGADMPLVRSFWLSTKKGKEVWVEPIADKGAKSVRFEVRTAGKPSVAGTTARSGATCVLCETFSAWDYVRQQSREHGLGAQMLAIVAEGNRSRSYLSPDDGHVQIARAAEEQPHWFPDGEIADNPGHTNVYRYGLTTWGSLFTPRQLVALTTLSDLVSEARELALRHACEAGLPDHGNGIADGGTGATAYADAVATYLALTIDRAADYGSSICSWHSSKEIIRNTFGRQALPMIWDFAEVNPFSTSSGAWIVQVEYAAETLETLSGTAASHSSQLDAASSIDGVPGCAIATDPPYYDNIGYADLSDFFYVWLRRSLGRTHPDLFSTLLTPKGPELVATPYRFGGDRKKAEKHFEEGLGRALSLMRAKASPDYPLSLYYAFKQVEVGDVDGVLGTIVSTGWQTMLNGLLVEGLEVIGTWPMRTELATRNVARLSNALASSIVLVCRPRPDNAPTATFKQFQSELAKELPKALTIMTGRDRGDGSEPWVDPIDLRQAAIGPGMAVYSRYRRVQKADGSAMTVREALAEINDGIDNYSVEFTGDIDRVSRFCLQWYVECGFTPGQFGRAEILAKGTNTDPEALEKASLLESERGTVRLFRPDEYRTEMADGVSIWELCHRLVGTLAASGEDEAARLYNRMPGLADEARDLAYRLYLEAEKKNRAQDALGYNALVASWTDIRKKASELREETQASLI